MPQKNLRHLLQKYPMAWVLFGTYYYNKLRYFMTSQKNHYVNKPRNIGIYSTLRQDTKCKRLDSIPVRVTNDKPAANPFV